MEFRAPPLVHPRSAQRSHSMFAGDAFALSDAGVAGFEDVHTPPWEHALRVGMRSLQDFFVTLTQTDQLPAPPPPPMPPIETYVSFRPTRIFFSNGPDPLMPALSGKSLPTIATGSARRKLTSNGIIDATSEPDVIDACSDGAGARTLCQTGETESAWIMLDLGAAKTIKVVRIAAYPDAVVPPVPPFPNPPPDLPPSPLPPPPPLPPPLLPLPLLPILLPLFLPAKTTSTSPRRSAS